MNKLALALATVALSGAAASCSSDNKDAGKPVPSDTEAAAAEASKIRFYNLDSISKNYKLIENLNAEANVAMTNYQNEERRYANQLQQLQAQIEDKARNNGYLTQQSYEADMQNYQTKATQAQNYLGNLQQQLAIKAQEQQQLLLDSINNFLRAYNADKGYEAIFVLNPGEYANPALDITDEIVEGLNARYDASNAPASAAAPAAK